MEKSYDADAFVWITPIYHNSFSSVLKNALDWQHTSFPGKVVGLASNGGERTTQAVDQLMWVARAQHLIAAPTRVCTHRDDFDEKRNIVALDIKKRIKQFAKELVDLTERVSA